MDEELVDYIMTNVSEATDVWSYAVTLWEIFSYGKVPYEPLTNRVCMPFPVFIRIAFI